MSDIYTQTLDALTAPDQTFAFKEEIHSSGVTYREFTNIPKTLANYFESVSYTHLRAHET